MLIEIKKIPEGERIFETELLIDDKLVEILLKTERKRSKILCLAEYKTEIDCECSRCLELFKQEISGEAQFFIVWGNEEFSDDDFDCYRSKNENDKIDFTQTIYDEIFVQVPMKPLCREDCAGIVLEEKDKIADSTEKKTETGQGWIILKK
jgi:uncharacterized protein